MWSTISPYLAAIVPTIIALTLFYFLIKAMLEGDRRERAAQRKWEAESHPEPPSGSPAQSPRRGTIQPRPQPDLSSQGGSGEGSDGA